MRYRVTVLPQERNIDASAGQNLMELLRQAGCATEASCGGNGTCGKCKVLVNGQEMLACQTIINRDMTVVLPPQKDGVILTDGNFSQLPKEGGLCLALDIGTTTVAAYLIENGQVLSTESRKNPQVVYGADVVSRIQQAVKGHAATLTELIRCCVDEMTEALFVKTGKRGLSTVCVVGNPAMQQLFLGLSPENLTKIPFRPLLQKAAVTEGGKYIPAWAGADLLIVPDIAGYIGADTVACILSTGMDRAETCTLLVDIGTNGEMVLSHKGRMVACATAAGPALEGAGIRYGMTAANGAIDRVEKDFSCHVIGEGKPVGICGSGLLDGVAVALEHGQINEHGRILNENRTIPLAKDILLTQEDIRQLQQAKGAIAAGIRLMKKYLNISLRDIETVYLAGAFGTFLDPHSACRVGLLPAELEDRIKPVGNAAGSGAALMACSRELFARAVTIVTAVAHLELATAEGWAKCFARSMRFESEAAYWCIKASAFGFSEAVPMDPQKLSVREDVRAMCAADKCGAYGKNWACPPHCGALSHCQEELHSFSRGILIQTVGTMQKAIDTKAYRDTEKRHLQQFHALAERIKAQHPRALCLGSGGCRVCKVCAYPEPCRFPEKICSSMEAYGLFVTQVCKDHNLPYYHGEKTVTYTACILF